MEFKTYLQLFLFSIIILISLIFFNAYFFKDEVGEKKTSLLKKEEIKNVSSNTIENVGYISEDNAGNKYTINSEFADLNTDESNLIVMKNVKAIVELKNSTPIIIYSKNAHYNNITFDTSFYDEVIMEHNSHKIESNSLDLYVNKNLVTISGNVIYNNLNTKMESDKIEFNLITKNFKIFMNDKKKLVKIKSAD